MKIHIKAPVLAVAAAFALSGCNLLDVDNPNNLVEESVQRQTAANAMANGSLRLVSEAVGDVWEAPAVVADELYWVGSRDAWGQLDDGFVDDPLNEFTDGAFPTLGRAVWMAQEAVRVLTVHVSENPDDDSFALDLARAQFFNGIILMVTGEIQDDMTFSDKMEDGPPVGPANMYQVLDDAIANLDAAISGFNALEEPELARAALAMRARAKMSRVIWDELNPDASGASPTALDFGTARDDAETVLDDIGGSDWAYSFGFSAASTGADILGNVNNRGENQIDQSIVFSDGPVPDDRGDITLMDPVDGEADERAAQVVTAYGDNQYGSLDIVTERLLRLIVAEDALQENDTGEFEAQIDAIRELNSKAEFDVGGAVGNMDMLMHERRVNTLFMGLRLQDMFRWGLQLERWQPASSAVTSPGQMLPITIIECRANQYLDNDSCATIGG
jgi:hypothetical protein